MKQQSNDNWQGRSEIVQEVLGHSPNNIIIRANLIIFTIIFVCVIICIIVKYPESIQVRVTILSNSPPIEVIAKSNGKLSHLLREDGDFVEAKDIIGVIESAANFKDITALSNILDTLGSDFNINNDVLSANYDLGSIQVPYSTFVKQVKRLKDFRSNIKLKVQISSINKQLDNNNTYKENLNRQVKILSDEIKIRKKWFKRDSILYEKELISNNTFETSKLEYFNNKKALNVILGQILQVAGEKTLLNNKIDEITTEYEEKLRTLYADVEESYKVLKSKIDIWRELYLLEAPICGKLTLTNVWSEEQFVSINEKVFTIVPDDDNIIVGRALLPVSAAGKVKKGQRVILKLDSYPYMEYGFVEGIVEKFSLVPIKEGGAFYYVGEIKLPYRLVSNYGKDLTFIQELQGSAEIMVNQKSVIERFYEPIKNILKNKK